MPIMQPPKNPHHPSGRAQGGSAVIVKNTFQYKQIDNICSNIMQVASIEIKCMHLNISIAAVYIPPRHWRRL